MATAYAYQPFDATHQQHGYMNGYQQPTYYQNQYVAQNVPQQPVYQQAPMMNVNQPIYGAPAPPPMVSAPAPNPYVPNNNYGYNNGAYYQQQPQPVVQQQQQQPQQQQEAVTGGVSSVLDYDLNIMSKFTTYLAFRLFGRSDTKNEKFASSIKSVLSATRLPLSSLILANYYLVQKYEVDSYSFQQNSDEKIYQIVILALVMSNKANDDNTFTNKSWSDATGLNVKLINFLEVQWLDLIDWKLHDTDMERYDELMIQYKKYADNYNSPIQYHSRSISSEPISPILSSSGSQFSPRDYSSPSRFDNFSNSNNWYTTSSSNSSSNYYNHYQPRAYSHNRSYSYQEPEYCTRTGSYQRMMYCSCHYCSTPTRPVDWSYNLAAAC
ncbi:PHO85 cyclin CLG1 [Wickerhamomyces ciferrii]|uniref:PHO85 cyclin CLG1 n=1 Tax=Wickerhamomyces ciferrii (strain ATCC 14091 / BCRC 22168 / CBS 111 / JCM 3599 / NBRC 0793 / NRRL Y-1031 F-60-10) TaxID=1206466 RepID=K0KS40_WICCF|nr:PHO85 cyclin CLG1 [Wickerhamomyces ciferrii]CCH44792.1 PHO85 cyclin CLG1 [Wickerhamomyces ciferrii]